MASNPIVPGPHPSIAADFGIDNTDAASIHTSVTGQGIRGWLSSLVSLARTGGLLMSPGGAIRGAFAAAGASASIVARPGRLCRVLITTAGTVALTFTDGNGGAVIGIVPANAAVGTVYDFQIPFTAGLYIVGGANTPAVTYTYN